MKSRVNLAVVAIRISTILYYLLIVGCIVFALFLPPEEEFAARIMPWIVAALIIPFVIFLEILIVHLKRRKYWAWIGGLIIGAMYAPSLFLPLGIMILIGLLSADSRAEFGVDTKNAGSA